MLEGFLSSQCSIKPECAVSGYLDNGLSFDVWKSRIRQKIFERLGFGCDWPYELVSEDPEEDKGPYSLQKIHFSISENLVCPCYVLIPKGKIKGLVLTLHGHGYGARDIVGLIGESTYEKQFAVSLAEQGFVTFSPELVGFGEMRLKEDIECGDWKKSSCHRLSANLLAAGKTLLGLRVYEAYAAIGLMHSRFPMLKAGVMGISGGGTVATFLSVVDDRISACVISGYANFFNSSILAMNHCICNYLPGMLESFEMPDILSAIAPMPMLWESGDLDPIYPQESTRKAEKIVRRCYASLDADENFICDYFSGMHEIHGKLEGRFFSDFLN